MTIVYKDAPVILTAKMSRVLCGCFSTVKHKAGTGTGEQNKKYFMLSEKYTLKTFVFSVFTAEFRYLKHD